MSSEEENKEPKKKEKKENSKAHSIFRKIVNGFIIFFGVIFIIIFLAIGFAQTTYFRNFAKDKITGIVNSSLNGKLSIDNIRGTFLTSIIIKDAALTVEGDSLLTAGKIEAHYNPLNLIGKKIYLSSLELQNVNTTLLQDENGVWNLDKLLPQKDTTAQKDSSGGFPFKIQINDLILDDVNLRRESYANRFTDAENRYLDPQDLQIENLNLNAKAFADINKNNYQLKVDNLYFDPNLSEFKLNQISGTINVYSNSAEISNLNIDTDSSNISLSAKIDSVNLFKDFGIEKLKNSPIQFSLSGNPMDSEDISSFAESMKILHGSPQIQFNAEGTYGDLDITTFDLTLDETDLHLTGNVKNLDAPENLFIKADINNSILIPNDVDKFIASFELPDYQDLAFTDLQINFNGEPLNFDIQLNSEVAGGSISSDASFNFEPQIPRYEIDLTTVNLNLNPVINTSTDLTIKAYAKGRGFDPTKMNSQFNISMNNSSFNGYSIDSLVLASRAVSKVIDLDLDAVIEESATSIKGELDLTNESIPVYDLKGFVRNLNLENFVEDTTLVTDLNFTFDADGENLDLDKMRGEFVIHLDSSVYQGKEIDTTEIALELKRDSSDYRTINLISDFLDFNVYGEFSVNNAISLLSYESTAISAIISDKIKELNPLNIVQDTLSSQTDQLSIPDIADEEISFEFDFEFKDFELIAIVLGTEDMAINGSGSGEVQNSTNNFSISTSLDILNFINISEDNLIYVSDFETSLNFSRDNQTLAFDNIFGALSITGKRFYSGSDVKNYRADLIFNQNKLFINSYAELNSILKVEVESYVEMTPVEQDIVFDNLWVEYENVAWENRDSMHIVFSKDHISFGDFALYNEDARIAADGTISKDGRQDLTISADSIPGSVVSRYLMGAVDPDLNTDVNFNTKINGTFEEPNIKADLNVTNISYGQRNLGSLLVDLNYDKKLIDANVVFVEDTTNIQAPKLKIAGTFPIDLSFSGAGERIPENQEVDLSITSEGFNLNTFGNLLPMIKNQRGELAADMHIGGTPDDLNYSGDLKINDGFLVVRETNLDYTFKMNLELNGQNISIEEVQIANAGGTKQKGTLNGSGEIVLDGTSLSTIDLDMSGDIAVLSQSSQVSSPLLYGTLFIRSDGTWNYKYDNGDSYFSGTISVVNADITFSPTSSYSSMSEGFTYEYVVDSSKIDPGQYNLDQLINSRTKKESGSQTNQQSALELDVTIRIVNPAEIELILSQVTNQTLSVSALGEMVFEGEASNLRAQGQFDLQDGSTLQLFGRTLNADGSIRFESDITDPYLDIVATYESEYNGEVAGMVTPQVAVKIHLQGPVSELGKNLANNPQNIGVYIGETNIANDVRSNRFDAADAISFIVIGKFVQDLTTQDEQKLGSNPSFLSSTATSVLGSFLGGFANSVVGDVVSDIQLSQTRDAKTRFGISGRYENFRYTLGGTEDVFSNFATANIRIIYEITKNLMLRLERKPPVGQPSIVEEKIDELGLRYRIEF